MKKYIFCNFFILLSIIIKAQIVPVKYAPEKYIVYKTDDCIRLDGILNEDAWKKALWTHKFVDIEGDLKPNPKYLSRVKMLWDENYLYFAAYLEEAHVWATLTERESVIFYDNDFEIFIDPDGDTHNYMEFEINALGTEWDLFLCKPYRDLCAADNSWNFEGLKSKVKIYGTLNNPTDIDSCWTIEIAIPWKSMIKYSETKKIPVSGEQWRINFSRVEWDFQLVNGIYIRKRNSEGKILPEHNWVWSPQGVIAMHRPETWGFIQFSDNYCGTENVAFIDKKEDLIKWRLRNIYYLQKEFYKKNKFYTDNLDNLLSINKNIDFTHQKFIIEANKSGYKAHIQINDSTFWYIQQDGKVYKIIK